MKHGAAGTIVSQSKSSPSLNFLDWTDHDHDHDSCSKQQQLSLLIPFLPMVLQIVVYANVHEHPFMLSQTSCDGNFPMRLFFQTSFISRPSPYNLSAHPQRSVKSLQHRNLFANPQSLVHSFILIYHPLACPSQYVLHWSFVTE